MADFNLSFAASELNAAITKANDAAPQSTTYTKAETDTLLADKPGEITTGKQYVIGGKTVTAGTGAEAFNDLNYNKAAGPYSHAEGQGTTASNNVAHAEGQGTTASGTASHAEGQSTTAASSGAHAEGQGTTASGAASHAEGQGTNAGSDCAHAEGRGTTAANGECTHAEGSGSKAVANAAHAEGEQTTATGQASHTEGVSTIANGKGAHAEGQGTTAVGAASHAEGQGTTAVSACQHVQGKYNKQDINNTYAFIIGNGTDASHPSNAFCVSWSGSVTEGQGTTASGPASHAEGYSTVASSTHQHVQGRYNVEDSTGKYAFIIGNGTADNARHNAFAIDWNGRIYVNGASTGVDVSALTPVFSPEDRKTTDIDAAVDPGAYRFYGNGQTTNLPSDITVTSPFGLLEVFVCGPYIKQVLTHFVSSTPAVPPNVYIRRSSDSGATWSPWGKFVGTEVN